MIKLKGNFLTMLKHAQDNNYAVPAFNFDNLEILKAIILAAEKQLAPVIIMITVDAIKFMGLEYTIAIVKLAITMAKVPIVLHLDHCFDSHFIKTKITSVFGSIMLDWSNYSLKENIEKTREIVQFAAPLGIAVEAKIQYISNKNDNLNDEKFINETVLFQNKTNINALAISPIIYNNNMIKPELPIALIKEIAFKMPEIPLVLHGTYAIDDKKIGLAIDAGIAKVNIGNELKIAYSQSLKDSFKKEPNLYDIMLFKQAAIEKVQKVVEAKIIVLRANNKVKL